MTLLLAAAVTAVGAAAHCVLAAKSSGPEQPAQLPPPALREAARVDRYGDPLPAGAVARLGTIRLRHQQMTDSVAFSPGGKFLASSGFEDTIRLWDSTTGRPVRQLTNRNRESVHSGETV
jgi:WD40 repeat protein